MDEEQQTPKIVESKDKLGNDPEELAYQKKYEKYLKQKQKYEYYLKNKERLDELKSKLETASLGDKSVYEKLKSEGWFVKDYGMLKLSQIQSVLQDDDNKDKVYRVRYRDIAYKLEYHMKQQFYEDDALKELYTINDHKYRITPKIHSRYLFYGRYRYAHYTGYYFYGTLSLPKKPIPPKKPVKKEVLSQDTSEGGVKPEIETLKTQVQLATLSKSIGGKEFLIGGERVDKKVYDLYTQYKKDWMIPSNQKEGKLPKPGTPVKYQNLSWEYFKTNILNKDERYSVM